MISDVLHIGLTVRDLDRSVAFYRDVMGLTCRGELLMEGPEADAMFGRPNSRARVAYLCGGRDVNSPPVELIQFTDQQPEEQRMDLFRTSISELCFVTDDIWREYERLAALGVEFLSPPQDFDFTADGFGKSRAVYLRDPDGIILELMQPL